MNPEQRSQTDDRVEAVLAALAAAEPRTGMEQRISAALHQAQAGASTSAGMSWDGWRFVLRGAGPPALALMLAIAAILTGHFAMHGREAHQAKAVRQSETEALDSSATTHAAPVPLSRARRISAASPVAVRNPRAIAALRQREAAGTTTEENIPEPPEPLTAQERLLVQLVHRNSPVQLSSLTPAAREAELQKNKEDVSLFFARPYPLEQEGQP